MIDKKRLDRFYGSAVYDSSGDKIGTVYLDELTDEPTFATVSTGLFESSESLVPLKGAHLDGSDVSMDFTKDKVRKYRGWSPTANSRKLSSAASTSTTNSRTTAPAHPDQHIRRDRPWRPSARDYANTSTGQERTETPTTTRSQDGSSPSDRSGHSAPADHPHRRARSGAPARPSCPTTSAASR